MRNWGRNAASGCAETYLSGTWIESQQLSSTLWNRQSQRCRNPFGCATNKRPLLSQGFKANPGTEIGEHLRCKPVVALAVHSRGMINLHLVISHPQKKLLEEI